MKPGRNNGVILVRTSERQAFLTCRQKWEWSWVERLRSPTTDVKLIFGDLVHQALAVYYKPGRKRGPHPTATFSKLFERLSDEPERVWVDDEENVSILDLGVDMLDRYVEHWSEQDKEYEIISSEQVFQVPIGRYQGKRVYYVGTIDGVWRHLPTMKIRFAEHKTAASIGRINPALAMDEQVGAYWTYGPRWLKLKGILKSGEDLDGILYNRLRKAIKKNDGQWDALGRRVNKDGSISKRQPPPWFDRQNSHRGEFERARVKDRVKQQVRDMQQAIADPTKHVYKNPGPSFMPNCQFCSFRDMCELHETGNDWEPFKTAAYTTWDPYAAHERPERM